MFVDQSVRVIFLIGSTNIVIFCQMEAKVQGKIY